MNLIEGLKTRFDIVNSSTSEKDFYLNCFYYYDYIFENPELLKIYEDAYVIYSKKFGDIWADWNQKRNEYLDSGRTIEPPEITTQPIEVSRMEKFDMYCNACGLEVRVYHPIKHYKECDCPHLCYDFNGSLLLNGLESTLRRYKDDYRDPKKEIKDTYKHWYLNQRDHYQSELSRFHVDFLNEVAKLDIVKTPETKELKPFLNLNTGNFSYFGKEGNFPVSGQEFKVLKTLLEAKDYSASHDELVRSYLPNVEKATKTQKSHLNTVIRNVKERLGVLPKSKLSKPDPFKSVRLYGYRLELPRC